MVSAADRERLVRYLSYYCRGRANRMKQPALAEALGWDTRRLQDTLSEEAQHNGYVGSGCGKYKGVWWSLDAEDARLADSNLAGRIGPLARRRRAIQRAFPGIGQMALEVSP